MAENIDELVDLYKGQLHLFEQFKNAVVDCFRLEPTLNQSGNPTIHSIKSRLKDISHLREKLRRKAREANSQPITPENLFTRITDLTGVRILHLCRAQVIQKILSPQDPKNTQWVFRLNTNLETSLFYL